MLEILENINACNFEISLLKIEKDFNFKVVRVSEKKAILINKITQYKIIIEL